MKPVQGVVFFFFFAFTGVLVPYIVTNTNVLAATIGSYVFFQIVSRLFTRRFFETPGFVEKKKNLELDNRIVSMFFNFGTGIPPYLAYFHQAPNLLPTITTAFLSARSDWMDFFAGWTVGYIMYDFPELVKIFAADPVIQLHHCAELLIVYCYAHQTYGGAYLFGGGLMQLSSGILHIQRILMVTNSIRSPFVLEVLRWLLAAVWIHSRLWVFPKIMYENYQANEMTPLHALCMLAGSILVLMSLFWLFKIISKKSLAFSNERKEPVKTVS